MTTIFCYRFLRFLLVGLPFVLAAAAEPIPLTLAEACTAALQNHPRISVAELRALAARQVTREVRSAFYPNLSANAVAVGTASDNTRLAAVGGLNNPSIFDRNAEGLMLTQLITDFGRTANLSGSAKLRALAEENNAQATRAQILLQVETAFFAALQAQAVLQVAEQSVATRQLFVDQVTALTRNQLRSELDLSFARVNLAEGRLLLSRAQNDRQAAFTDLATLMGLREPKDWRAVEEPLPEEDTTDVTRRIAAALSSRPELLRLRHERDAALKLAKAERALHYPTLSAVGSAGILPVHDDRLADNYAAAGLVLSVPIFSGNFFSARQKEAELRARAVDESLRDEENTLIRDVRVTWLNTQNARERLQIAGQLREHATLAYQLAEARYQSGASSFVELNQAQLNQISAEITHATTRYEYLAQRARLDFQSGALH